MLSLPVPLCPPVCGLYGYLSGAGPLREFVEGLPAIGVHGILTDEGLPTTNPDIDVTRLHVHRKGASTNPFGCRRTASQVRSRTR
jgi:hypothetical protein